MRPDYSPLFSTAPTLDLISGQSLNRFRRAKEAELRVLQMAAAAGTLPPVLAGPRPSLFTALHPHAGLPAVIAEYKRASPSRGWIQQHLSPEEVGAAYQQAGAAAMSVLTEESHFHGHMTHLERVHAAGVMLPLLRKDFIFDPLQIVHSASTPAAAILLIVSLTPSPVVLRDLREQAEALGMDAVVEVFTATELDIARESGARIIQVNARNLTSFQIDMEASLALARLYRHRDSAGCTAGNTQERWVAASGVTEHSHLTAAVDAGFDAVLVGTSLMEQGQPAQALTALLRGHIRPQHMRQYKYRGDKGHAG